MKHTFTVIIVVCYSTLVGCSVPAPKTTAECLARPYLKRVLPALAVYQKDHGEYPETLEQLHPSYLQSGVPMHTSEGAQWGFLYARTAPERYLLFFCDSNLVRQVVYENGKLMCWIGPDK